jgi:hypothetical protein
VISPPRIWEAHSLTPPVPVHRNTANKATLKNLLNIMCILYGFIVFGAPATKAKVRRKLSVKLKPNTPKIPENPAESRF